MRLMLFLALAGCDVNFFDKPDKFPTNIPCSSDPSGNPCPPYSVCVAGENICRRPCTHPGQCMGGNCPCANSSNNGSSDTCDVDLFCRPSCGGGGPGNMCVQDASCPGGQMCDNTNHVCRAVCSSGCAGGFTCANLNGCSLCVPSAAPVPDGGMPGPDMAMPAMPVFVTHEAIKVRFIALDGQGNIFWNNDQGVLFCPLADCSSPQPIGLAHGVNGLTVTSNKVVWSDGQGNVNVCPTSGCTTPTVLASGQANVGVVGNDGTGAYWMAASPAPRLLGCNLNGCGTPASLINGPYGGNLATTLGVGGGFVCWTSQGSLYRCSTGGCSTVPILESPGTPSMGLWLAAPNVYVSGSDCIDVCDVTSLSCTPKIACNGGQANIVQSLVADDKDLFWSIGSTLRHCSLPCNNMNAHDVGNAQMASVVAMDASFFYWGDFSAGAISKVAR